MHGFGTVTSPHSYSRSRHHERGSLVVGAAIVLLVVAGAIFSGLVADRALDTASDAAVAKSGQARAVAEAGIVDAFAWFRRQQTQPVLDFAPKLDATATPTINETDQPSIGLVREYEIEPSLWGRYEIRLSQDSETFVDANGNGHYDGGEAFTDANNNGRWDPGREVQDVSQARGLPGDGGVWRIVSHGFLYRRSRGDLPLTQAPNRSLAKSTLATEIRRLTLTPPAAAALCGDRGDRITAGPRARVLGASGAGIAYANSTGTPSFASGHEVSGSPRDTAQPEYDSSIEAVFGVSLAELKSMADVSTADPSGFASPIGDFTLNVIEGNITFDDKRPLRGTGIVVVLGNCTIESGSNSFFSGLLWVQGRLDLRAPCYLRGIAIGRGVIDVRGVGGDFAELNYDSGIVSQLLSLMGQYRYSKALFVPGDEPSLGVVPGGS